MDKAEFRKILKKVEKPARYLGNEVNSIHKDTSNKDLIRYAQCFPDLYEVGMSHLGSQILYRVLNSDENVYCERVYSPAIDMEEILREKNIPGFISKTLLIANLLNIKNHSTSYIYPIWFKIKLKIWLRLVF